MRFYTHKHDDFREQKCKIVLRWSPSYNEGYNLGVISQIGKSSIPRLEQRGCFFSLTICFLIPN
uniref:Uncharacterized protein n=1 Tax=Meloidogyne incognita TaxID=6306 RepID=A0A914LYS5_MELIC